MDNDLVVCLVAVSAIGGAGIYKFVTNYRAKMPRKKLKLTTAQIVNVPTQRNVRFVLPRDEAKAKYIASALPIEVAPATVADFKEVWRLICDMHYDHNYNYKILDIETIMNTTRSLINRSLTSSSKDCNKYFSELTDIVKDLCPLMETFYENVEKKWKYINKDMFPGLERAMGAMQEFVMRTHEKNIEAKLVIFEIPYKEGKLFDILHIALLEDDVVSYSKIFEKKNDVEEVYKLLKAAKTMYLRYDLSKKAEYAMKMELENFESFVASQGDILLLIQQEHDQD